MLEQEADIAEPGHQERLHCPGPAILALPVVTDQQVRAGAHQFPADQQQEQAVVDATVTIDAVKSVTRAVYDATRSCR